LDPRRPRAIAAPDLGFDVLRPWAVGPICFTAASPAARCEHATDVNALLTAPRPIGQSIQQVRQARLRFTANAPRHARGPSTRLHVPAAFAHRRPDR
jgi:hypothetical protein